MIRHVVMWKFFAEAEGKTKQENMHLVQEQLYALVAKIPEILRMEIGMDVKGTDASMDLMLLTEFESVADMKIYAEHPEHKKVSVYVRRVIESRVVLDAEID